MIKRLITLGLLAMLVACVDVDIEKENTVELSPQATAEAFFAALYVENNVKAAIALADKPIAGLLEHYHLASQIQHHVLGLSLKDVTIDVTQDVTQKRKRMIKDDSSTSRVKVGLTGFHNGKRVMDERHVLLKKGAQEKWLISELINDPIISS